MRVAPILCWCLPLLAAGGEPRTAIRPFGTDPQGSEVQLVTLRNASGMEASVMTWGATLVEVRVPDREGKFDNVNLRLNSLNDYLAGHPMMGSTVGRFANRIDTGSLTIEGKRYPLQSVDPKTGIHIHGGKTGFHSQNWTVKETWEKTDRAAAVLTLQSPDQHEGYPGTVRVTATFSLADDNTFTLNYEATTDAPTHVNLTNHSYWNLGGAASGSVLPHTLQLAASRVLEFDPRKIPTGTLLAVEGTPLDFRLPHPLGERIQAVSPGYDHCFALDPDREKSPGFAARLEDPRSGRVMELRTSAPGIQVYTANHLKNLTHDGHTYAPQEAVCLECQHFPDTPNHPDFPSTLLVPGQVYQNWIEHRFSVRN